MLEAIRELIRDKRVLVLGYGREGKSTMSIIQEVKGYKKLAISDMNKVEAQDDIEVIYGASKYLDCLDEYDIVFKSPGVVLEKPVNQYSCRIVSQTECFFSRYKNQIIGITGTKGKSTTTTLIYNILKKAGRKVILAGNIGIPAFDVYREIEEDTVIVFEMSSHQLEYMTVAPHIGVYLNIHEEHLDHYKTMDKYVRAKENIYRNQTEDDILFVNEAIKPSVETCLSKVITIGYEDSDVRIDDLNIIYEAHTYKIPADRINLLGTHNYFNIAVAYGVCQKLHITDTEFENGLVTYQTLPHRLEYFATVNDVKYYDDSISTICDTAIQALKSIKDVATIIIGGMDRGIDYKELIDFLSTHKVQNIILMATTGKRIYNEIVSDSSFNGFERIKLVDTLDEAVVLAKSITPKKCSCVMSPAAASYGIYKNFEERGDVFKKLVCSDIS